MLGSVGKRMKVSVESFIFIRERPVLEFIYRKAMINTSFEVYVSIYLVEIVNYTVVTMNRELTVITFVSHRFVLSPMI